MRNRERIILFSCLVGLSLLLSPCIRADESDWFRFDFGVSLNNRFHVKQNFLNTEGSIAAGTGREATGTPGQFESPLNLKFNKDEIGYAGYLHAGSVMNFGSSVSFHLSLDSGELKFRQLTYYRPKPQCSSVYSDPRCGVTSNGRTIGDEAANTWFVREVFLSAGFGFDDWARIHAGKRLTSVGNGYIMDNYALVVSLTTDLDLGFDVPLRIRIEGMLPNGDFTVEGKRSPMVHLDIAYLLSFFEEVGLFLAWYRDGDDSLGRIFLSTLAETLGLYEVEMGNVTSRGNIYWAGLRANKVFDRASLSGTAIIEFGSFDTSVYAINPINGQPISVQGSPQTLGGMADLAFHYDLTDDITAGCFFLWLSGENSTDVRESVQTKYTSFISLYPYITRTNIFFSGGMNQNFSARTFSPSGVNARGVLAPGLTFGFDLTEDITIRLVSAVLFSQGMHPESRDRFYGWENDLNFQWNIGNHVRLLLEADYLWTGGFFDFYKPLDLVHAQRSYTEEPDAWKIMLGLDVFY